jgi:hypothetical protein
MHGIFRACTIGAMKYREILRAFALAAMALGYATSALAGTLASAALVAPLAPGNESRLAFAMPPGFAPDQPVWVAYELVALSPDDEGEVALEQSFEGVRTALSDMFVTFKATDMLSREAGGTVAQRLQQIAGERSPEELRALFGEKLYSAYQALGSGQGRVLGGQLVRQLAAPGRSDAALQISVERAEVMQPLALKVTFGQGALPAQFQEKAESSLAYKAGYAAGLGLFGWLVLRFFRRRG